MAEGSKDISTCQAGAAPTEANSRSDDGYQAARAQFAARRAYKRAIRRARNPFYFSLRSLVLLAFLVVIAGAATLALIFALRGDATARGLAPVIAILESTPDSSDAAQARPSATTAAPAVQVIVAAETQENLELDGPAIPTVIITNTPIPLRVGVQAVVAGVGNDKLNIRNRPSLADSQVLFRESEGKRFDIIGGPREADGYSWWQVRDPQFQVEGWAVANYLRTVAEAGSS